MRSLAVWMPLVIVGLVLLFVVIGVRFAAATGAESRPRAAARRTTRRMRMDHHKMNSPAQEERKRTASALDNLSSQLSDINQAAEQLLGRMHDLMARAHGPMLQEASSKLSEVPAGVIGTMRDQADWLSRRIGAMTAAFEVIETII